MYTFKTPNNLTVISSQFTKWMFSFSPKIRKHHSLRTNSPLQISVDTNLLELRKLVSMTTNPQWLVARRNTLIVHRQTRWATLDLRIAWLVWKRCRQSSWARRSFSSKSASRHRNNRSESARARSKSGGLAAMWPLRTGEWSWKAQIQTIAKWSKLVATLSKKQMCCSTARYIRTLISSGQHRRWLITPMSIRPPCWDRRSRSSKKRSLSS